MPSPKEGKLLYHLTHIDNMASILCNGLLPRNTLEGNFIDTADPDIIAGRHEFNVDLGNYIPFHFFVKNPYDGAVCKKRGAENMVIISIYRPDQKCDGFFIIPKHPLSRSPDFLPYDEGFEKVSWDLMESGDNRDYSNPIIKTACMAECDVDRPISVDEFAYVYVKTERARDFILDLPYSEKIKNKLQVKPNMFP